MRYISRPFGNSTKAGAYAARIAVSSRTAPASTATKRRRITTDILAGNDTVPLRRSAFGYDAEPVATEMRATDLPDELADKLLGSR